MNLLLLFLGVAMSAVYAIGLKPAMVRCRTRAVTELFNGAATLAAALCALLLCVIKGAFALPAAGMLTAALFGIVFSLTVYFNLVALDHGPLSLTNLIINFSLIVPLVYGFAFLDEQITALRMVGIALFAVCMFLFCNPFERTEGGRGASLKWFLLTMASFITNGMLMIIQKSYAIKTDNAYAVSFLFYSYLFATVTSVLMGLILKLAGRVRTSPPSVQNIDGGSDDSKRFLLIMGGLALAVGISNFGLNLAVILLATRMDSAIVYPVIQGGGPVIVTVVSRFLFKERLNIVKWIGVLLGCIGIVLLNL